MECQVKLQMDVVNLVLRSTAAEQITKHRVQDDCRGIHGTDFCNQVMIRINSDKIQKHNPDYVFSYTFSFTVTLLDQKHRKYK